MYLFMRQSRPLPASVKLTRALLLALAVCLVVVRKDPPSAAASFLVCLGLASAGVIYVYAGRLSAAFSPAALAVWNLVLLWATTIIAVLAGTVLVGVGAPNVFFGYWAGAVIAVTLLRERKRLEEELAG